VPDDVVVLRNYSTEVEAHLAAAVLEANGIDAAALERLRSVVAAKLSETG
jgi:hypothetical protein